MCMGQHLTWIQGEEVEARLRDVSSRRKRFHCYLVDFLARTWHYVCHVAVVTIIGAANRCSMVWSNKSRGEHIPEDDYRTQAL
jgi:hypothetical protein